MPIQAATGDQQEFRTFLADPGAILDAVDGDSHNGSGRSQLIECGRQLAEDLGGNREFSRPNRELDFGSIFSTVCRYPTKPSRCRSTGATADGFDRQFGIGRGGDASRQLIGNVEALCQSIDPGRVFIGKSLRGRWSPRRFVEQVQCLHLPDVCPAYRLDRPWACYIEGTVPETIRFKYRAFLSYSHRINGAPT